MHITITVDADYTASWEAYARLTFPRDPDGRDDAASRINVEERIITEALLAAINSLEDIGQMPYDQPVRGDTPLPEEDAILTTRITHKTPRHGLYLN